MNEVTAKNEKTMMTRQTMLLGGMFDTMRSAIIPSDTMIPVAAGTNDTQCKITFLQLN